METHTHEIHMTSLPSWYIRHLAAVALFCSMESLVQSLLVLFSFLSFMLLMNLDYYTIGSAYISAFHRHYT